MTEDKELNLKKVYKYKICKFCKSSNCNESFTFKYIKSDKVEDVYCIKCNNYKFK